MKTLSITLAATLLAGAAQAMPAPTHIYEFSGSYADAQGGPAMTGAGGTFTGSGATGGLTFAANQGPSLTGGLANGGNYSLELFFELDDHSNYRKLIDFKSRANDNGLYSYAGQLYFVGASKASQSAVFVPNQIAHLVLTRDGLTEETVAYVNGQKAFFFFDEFDHAVFGNAINILRDDGRGGGGEATGGFIDFFRTYDRVLSSADVTALYNGGAPLRVFDAPTQVPEPVTFGLFAAGLAGVGTMRLRRKLAAA